MRILGHKDESGYEKCELTNCKTGEAISSPGATKSEVSSDKDRFRQASQNALKKNERTQKK